MAGTWQTRRVTVIDNAIYRDGARALTPATLDETFAALERHPGGFAWIGLYRPDEHELGVVARQFRLHPLAVEDALAGHQRPKLERYADSVFVVLRPARYLDATEEVEFGEIHLFVGADYVVVVRHAEGPDLARVRHRLEEAPAELARGPMTVLYAILDHIVDEYRPVLDGIEDDVDEIEQQLFSGDAAVTRRIYELSGEVMDLLRATKPLRDVVTTLHDEAGRTSAREADVELQRSFRDVLDHVLRVVDKAGELGGTLQNALTANATLVAQRQNEEMERLTQTSLAQTEQTKKISSWAAIIFAPSLITGIYGMNFAHMPELAWEWSYPIALAVMAGFAFTLYRVFKKRNWL